MPGNPDETEAIVVPDQTAVSDAGRALDPADSSLLATMPLHAITSVHGEAGLRGRLLLEIAQFPAADRGRVTGALALAARLHAHDRRQREPYANHVLRVTIRILSHYQVADPDVTCAALLHDAVEDHAADIAPGQDREAAVAVLAGQFGERAAALVAAVTNPVYDPGRDKDQQYREHLTASLAASPWARIIKASDFTDNGVGLIHTTGPKAVRLARKYAPLVPVLSSLIARPDTPLSPYVKVRVLGQLRAAQERFTAITSATADSTLLWRRRCRRARAVRGGGSSRTGPAWRQAISLNGRQSPQPVRDNAFEFTGRKGDLASAGRQVVLGSLSGANT